MFTEDQRTFLEACAKHGIMLREAIADYMQVFNVSMMTAISHAIQTYLQAAIDGDANAVMIVSASSMCAMHCERRGIEVPFVWRLPPEPSLAGTLPENPGYARLDGRVGLHD